MPLKGGTEVYILFSSCLLPLADRLNYSIRVIFHGILLVSILLLESRQDHNAFPYLMLFTAFDSSSIVNGPFLMFSSSVKTGVMSLSVILGWFPNRFVKCFCHS